MILVVSGTFGTFPSWSTTFEKIAADRAQDGNPAIHAFDTDTETRWAAQGRGSWLQCRLDKPMLLKQVAIGFARHERDYTFTISTSQDGTTWSVPHAFQSRGQAGVINYPFPQREAQWIRVTVSGSDHNEWANIHTIRVNGVTPLETKTRALEASDGFVVSEWARDPAVVNGVGLSFDDHGRAFLTTVHRRKQSSLDIRNHQDLVKRDLALKTVEERRAFYRTYLTGKSWLPDRNRDGVRDWRDLTVQQDTATMVTDTDGDGTGETFSIIDRYHSEVTGIAAGILAVNDTLFVAAEPEFLRYTDKDGDGIPETKQVVAEGLQVHMGQGGHNLSGVTLGPDGRVYWSLADKGHHLQTAEGKRYERPNSGAIFRCELDGTRVERYSTGERNAQELAFDAHGNLFSMDNDGDYPGEKERALYITEGSEHGWRLNWQWLRKQDFIKISGLPAYNPWMDERLFLPDHPDHAAYLTPTLGNFGPGPCGFTSNPGTALSEALADAFFMTNQKGEVRVFHFHPHGASFTFEEERAIKGGLNNTGLAIGPDGALYTASYGTSKGAIYRFDVEPSARHPLRENTQAILAQPADNASVAILTQWLNHPDQRVRIKGQFALVQRDQLEALSVQAANASTLLGRLHAIWGLGQLTRNGVRDAPVLATALDDPEAEVVAQAAKVLGDLPSNDRNAVAALPKLRALLSHSNARVNFFASISLGKLRDTESVDAIVSMLATRGPSDPYLRHAAAMGLSGAGSPDRLAALADHPSRTVRLGAIVALRRLQAPEVRAFLQDADEMVLLEAARAIHDDASISTALGDLASLLERANLKSEALMRRVINAAFREGSDRSLQLLKAYLQRGEGSSTLRRTALASILWWSQPPVLDAVEGRYRAHAPRDASAADAVVSDLKHEVILQESDLLEVLLNGIVERRRAAWLEGLEGAENAHWPAPLQARFLTALAHTDAPTLRAAITRGLQSPHAAVRESAREHASAAGIPLVDTLIAILDDPQPAGQGKAVLQLSRLEDPRATAKLRALADAYQRGEAAPEWKLELWQAATAQGIALPASPDRLAYGGDSKRGQKLVQEHAAAQCVRCHQIGAEQPEAHDTTTIGIGPELTHIGKTRDRPYLVRALLEPSKDIAPGHGTIVLKTTDGEDLAGTLVDQQPDAWTITLSDGKTRVVKPSEVATHTLTSVMPPAGALLSPEEIRDVVSYLATLK